MNTTHTAGGDTQDLTKGMHQNSDKAMMVCVCAQSAQLCPVLCDQMNYSPLGSSVCGVLQARILEWVAMPFPRESSRPRDQTCISTVSCTGWAVYHQHHLGIPAPPQPGLRLRTVFRPGSVGSPGATCWKEGKRLSLEMLEGCPGLQSQHL